MKNFFLVFWFLAWVPSTDSCTSNAYLKTINSYLNASDTAEKSKYMTEDFHSFFMNKEGSGKTKLQALQSFQDWDGPLHPDVRIIQYTFHDSVWQVNFNEQNDFAKGISYPGWKGTTTFVFNAQGLIKETVYVPDSTNLSYKPYLQPALEWLQKNKPDELNEVYQSGKLIQTETTANKWRMLLQKWQSEKNNSSKQN